MDDGVAPNMRQAIIWTSVDLIHWRMYAALGGDELSHQLASDILLDIHKLQWKGKELCVVNILQLKAKMKNYLKDSCIRYQSCPKLELCPDKTCQLVYSIDIVRVAVDICND